MRRLIACLALCLTPAAFAQTPPAAPVKADAGTAPQGKPPLDVSKMPFSSDTIRIVVNHSSDQIQACYEDTLAGTQKKVQGKLMTSFIITPQGMVKGAKVLKKGTTLKEPKLHDCVVAVLTALSFPAPADGADHPVEYPFNLKAVE